MAKLRSDSVLDFDKLRRLTVIEGTLINDTSLRVGLGREAPLGAPIDLAVITMSRDGERVEYIPGSSLKGVFRSFVEQLARSVDPDLHEPWDFKSMEGEEEKGEFCVVCAIFGSTQVASHVRVYDAFPAPGSKPTKGIKTGVGIDREFQAARPGVLYTEEFVEPGCRWGFRMDVINIEYPGEGDERSRYLGALFEALRGVGLQVGARRSVGMGLLRLEGATYRAYSIINGSLKLVGNGEL